MAEVSPATAASSVKVRRYVPSDIGKILELARQACDQANVPYSAERLKFVLDNNAKNVFLCANVLVDIGEVMGVLIAGVRKSVLSDNSVAEDNLFYIIPDYQEYVNLMYDEYVNWAKQRGCGEVKVSDLFMPGAIYLPQPKFTVWKETI